MKEVHIDKGLALFVSYCPAFLLFIIINNMQLYYFLLLIVIGTIFYIFFDVIIRAENKLIVNTKIFNFNCVKSYEINNFAEIYSNKLGYDYNINILLKEGDCYNSNNIVSLPPLHNMNKRLEIIKYINEINRNILLDDNTKMLVNRNIKVKSYLTSLLFLTSLIIIIFFCFILI